MSVAPDLPGFKDAQQRLRDHFGEEVTFLGPPEEEWDPSVPIDPETKRPYDPVIEADTRTQPETVVKCNVVFKAINRAGISGEAEATALGWVEGAAVMLIADISEMDSIADAVEFLVRDERWKVTATHVDGIGGTQRYLVYGRKE